MYDVNKDVDFVLSEAGQLRCEDREIRFAEEIQRLRAEVLSLRASFGEVNGAEPIGCPCPGACSSPTVNSQTESGNSALKSRKFSENKHENSLISDRMTCAEKTPDFSGLFSLLRHMTCSDEVNTQKWARELEQELTKMGVKR